MQPINDTLAPLYPAFEGLDYDGPLQLVVATILSAQCTDARVNTITPALFARFPTARDFAECDIKELERLVKPSGFYKNKAKNIRACCVELVTRFGGDVPTTLDDLAWRGPDRQRLQDLATRLGDADALRRLDALTRPPA